jgi:hypothetical protein
MTSVSSRADNQGRSSVNIVTHSRQERRHLGDAGLILPKGRESTSRQLCIPDSVLDVPMAEVMLDRTRVVPLVGELEAAGMTKHMRVDGKAEFGIITSAGDDLPHRGIGHRPSPLGREDVRGTSETLGVVAAALESPAREADASMPRRS